MQFHENGFVAGDPERSQAARNTGEQPDTLPKRADVLIVGCGPAGLTLATQLSAFADISTVIVDKKQGPMTFGQADGIACRTMEMFEAFSFSEKILKESYWVNETTFWRPDSKQPAHIVRSDRMQDTEDGLSEFPHVILSQARVHDRYLEKMAQNTYPIHPFYARNLKTLTIDRELASQLERYPVRDEFEVADAEGNIRVEVIEARFAVGCDGAHSAVRAQLGYQLEGDSVNSAWGVMDVLAVTDFPDIRMKSAIHSAEEGSMLIIPREGGHMVRLYIEIAKLRENERLAREEITLEHLIAAAQRIIHPYQIEVKDTVWWSVYQIGQRVCASFDDLPEHRSSDAFPRVFIAGDACHTHSPKAGQGMNVSMADAFNLGWKMAAVINQQSSPALLHSYSQERHAVAYELIEFDKQIAKLFSSRNSTQNDIKDSAENNSIAEAFQQYFQKHARYTAGVETRYEAGLLTQINAAQALATGFPEGMRFHSAPAIRLADAKPVHLGHCIKADGRWRLFAFARPIADHQDRLGGISALCQFLEADEASPVVKYSPADKPADYLFDLRVIFQESFREVELEIMPEFLMPRQGSLGLKDYEKIFCADKRPDENVFDMRGIDRQTGCIVIVRPDQYVATILALEDVNGLASFFDRFMLTT